MPGAIHELAVAKIISDYPAAKTRGLMRAIRAALPEYARPDFNFMPGIPDAFIVDRENEAVILFEVEAGHPVNDAKMEDYCDLWWGLDGEGWDLLLIIIDRWGSITAKLDMGVFAIKKLVHEAKKSNRRPDPEAVKFVEEFRLRNADLIAKLEKEWAAL